MLPNTPVFDIPPRIVRRIGEANSIGTSAPTADSEAEAILEAHGRAPLEGKVSIAVDAAKTVTMRVFSPAAGKWFLHGAAAANHTKAYLANAEDVWYLPADSLFHITIDAGNCTAWTSAPLVDRSPGH